MRLNNVNTDQAVGTVWSKPQDFDTAENINVQYEFPLKLLVKGTYYASIGFYQMNDIGNMVLLDHITRAFKIEVKPDIQIIHWNTHAYGNILLTEI